MNTSRKKHTDCWRFLSQRKDYFENRFHGRPEIASISRESILLISALLKCLIYGISDNCSYGKALSKLPYLPRVFVFFINVCHFVIIEKGISFLFDAS